MATSKILWAVDPFDSSVNSSAVESLLRDLTKALQSEVMPAFVLSGPTLKSDKAHIQREVDRKISKLKLQKLKACTVLTSGGTSIRAAAGALQKFAKSKNAKAIVVPSHARTGLSRFVLGSFAETMMLESRLPLIIVNPKATVKGPIRHILFATDLESASKKSFLETYELAKRLGAKLTLFHAIPAPMYSMPVIGTAFVGPTELTPSAEEVRMATEASRRKAEAWVGNRKDVTVVIHKNVLSVSGAIAAHAKKSKAQLIAIEAQSNALSAALVGSITRNVVRSATCPVWITRFRK